MADPVGYELRGEVALVTLDDGKANAFSHDVIDALHGRLDQAEKEAGAVVLAGRPGRFSAGFDLSVMRSGGSEGVVKLVKAGAELALRIYEFPAHTVAACTGHAIAMGAITLLVCDQRIGAEGDFKLALNEVAIGMTLPVFGVEFARDRLSKRHLTRAVLESEVYDPAAAVDAGYLDRIVPAAGVVDEACAVASGLAGGLNQSAHAATKRSLRAATIAHVRQSLADMGDITN